MTLSYALLTEPNSTAVDISQQAGRTPVGRDGLLPTICTSAKLYMTEQKRILTGMELLMLHGMPRRLLDHGEYADNLMKDLAGNSFLAGAVMAVLISIYLHIPAEWVIGKRDGGDVGAVSDDPDPRDDAGAEAAHAVDAAAADDADAADAPADATDNDADADAADVEAGADDAAVSADNDEFLQRLMQM